MGKIIKLDPAQLIPTQNELREDNFEKLLFSYIREPKDLLIWAKPSKLQKGKYLTGDGHHRSCFVDVLNEFGFIDLYSWIPENNRDYIPSNLTDRFFNDNFDSDNHNIWGRFDNLENDVLEKYPSIKSLRNKYNWLESSEEMFHYFASCLELNKN